MNERTAIQIGVPYVDFVEDRARLCADITEDGVTRTLYYEVEKKYATYLNVDRIDTFVLGLLHHAMHVGKDIVSNHGITEQLLFQLRHFYIPVIGKKMPDLDVIDIEAPAYTEVLSTEGAVGTGNSGGIDSFYTGVRFSEETGSYKLTHFLFNNISTEDSNDERIREWFEHDKIEKRRVAKEMNLEAVDLYSNLYSFYKSHFIYNYYYAAQYISAPYALGKLFGVYYYSSSYLVEEFTIERHKMSDGSNFDVFALECFSTKQLKIYSTGADVNRVDKTRYIMNNPIVQRHLQVCAVDQNGDFRDNDVFRTEKLNCGQCRKCMRTVSTLYGLGVLDDFKEIFDLSKFHSNMAKYVGYALAADHPEFSNFLYKLLKENGKLPKYALLWKRLYKIRFVFSNNKYIYGIYSKLIGKKKK